MSIPLVIYHGGCVDGFTAAWVIERCLKGAQLYPATYGEEPPDVDHRTVFVVDFSYPRKTLENMASYANRMIVLDHHKSAEAELAGLRFATFDNEESGATLAFQLMQRMGHTFQLSVLELDGMVEMCRYVKDRDLWQWKLLNSREINTAIKSYEFDLDTWDRLASQLCRDPLTLAGQGRAIMRYEQKLIDSHVLHARDFLIAGWNVPVAECTAGNIISEVAGKLAENRAFGATYFMNDKSEYVFSLRSRGEGGADVSEIAAMFPGGGGHRNAAGFTVSRDAMDFENKVVKLGKV